MELLLSAIITVGISATLNFKCQGKLPHFGFVNTGSLSVWGYCFIFYSGSAQLWILLRRGVVPAAGVGTGWYLEVQCWQARLSSIMARSWMLGVRLGHRGSLSSVPRRAFSPYCWSHEESEQVRLLNRSDSASTEGGGVLGIMEPFTCA